LEEGVMELKTRRTVLREYFLSDTKDLQAKIDNPKVSKYLAVVAFPYKMKDARWFVNHCIEKRKKKSRESYELAITSRETGDFMGGAGLSNIDRRIGTAELGYWIAEEYWRKGYMTEVISALIDFAFKDLKLNKLNISAYVPNKGSNGLAKKLGFKLEGTTRQDAMPVSTGKVYDTNHWGLLKKEWKK
jgi:[ribosomal protein S5]-alanine N-acetyltransferase